MATARAARGSNFPACKTKQRTAVTQKRGREHYVSYQTYQITVAATGQNACRAWCHSKYYLECGGIKADTDSRSWDEANQQRNLCPMQLAGGIVLEQQSKDSARAHVVRRTTCLPTMHQNNAKKNKMTWTYIFPLERRAFAHPWTTWSALSHKPQVKAICRLCSTQLPPNA